MKTGIIHLFIVLTSVCVQAGVSTAPPDPGAVPEGLAKSDWQSIRAAYEAGRHAFQPIEGGWQAPNPGQQWTTKFDGRGFVAEPRGGGWQWGLELQSYGWGEKQTAIGGTPAVKAEGQRLSYQWDSAVQEWFVNDARGLEHGFTVKERPAQIVNHKLQIVNPLSFLLSTRGTLRPAITADAQGVLFQDASGTTVLNYTGLKVWDADGKVLASRFEAVGEKGVRLLVDERGARYPLTIDPIAQQASLKSADGTAGDHFGKVVAVSDDTLVVGAEDEDTGGGSCGAAYVFTRNAGVWTQQAYLKASNAGAGDFFGASVAIAGDTVVVGANGEDSNTTGVNSTPEDSGGISFNSGAAYVFVRNGTTWTQQAYLKPAAVGTTQAGDQFGASVSVAGDTVVVGAFGEGSSTTVVNSTPNESAFFAGAAYVFTRSATTWTQQAYLKASNLGAGDVFGVSVSVSGDTLVVGALGEDSSTTGVNSAPNDSAEGAGAAYVFFRNGTTWTQQAYLKPAAVGTTQAGDQFGYAVGVSGDTVVIGAGNERSSSTGVNGIPNESAPGSGAAYVFTRSGTTWTQQAYLKASNTGANDVFGASVAVAGNTVIIGAYGEDSSTTGVNSTPNESALYAGAAYVFLRSGTTWTQQAYLKSGNTGADDRFGISVAISVDTVVVGALWEDTRGKGVNGTPDENAVDSGAAYVFTRGGTIWTQQAFVKTGGNPTANDQFGRSVAVSGNTAVVGAWGEASSTSGVNSVPNESAPFSGAAYVFVRTGTTWNLQAYLKASNPGANDSFGVSVDVSGDTIIVGSHSEGSITTGVNGTPNENAPNAGAAYVFVRSGTTWAQQAFLKASNTEAVDQFGRSVSVSGDTVVVGALFEDSSSTGVNSTPNEAGQQSGAAYVFTRSGVTWTQQAYLKASNTGGGAQFGTAVSISADTLVVGAPREGSSTTGVNSTPNNGAGNAGAAYVFVRSGSTWSQQAYLKASNTGASDLFGSAVAVAYDTVVVGATVEDSGTTGINSVPDESLNGSGAAYVFTRTGTTWSQQAYLKASNTGAADEFGTAVATNGEIIVVGAQYEDSSTTGVNTVPNESAADSGAAYVFTRSGTTWTQYSYLKASNTGANDRFGRSVAVGGDTVFVGACLEDSGAPSGDTPDESAADAGAAYVFLSTSFAEIAIEQPVGSGLVDGGAAPAFGLITLGASSPPKVFTVKNLGFANLSGFSMAKDGSNSTDYLVDTSSMAASVVPGGSTTFSVTFSPGGTVSGTRAAALHLVNNDADESPFDIALTGVGLSTLTDTDGDRLNDAAEGAFAALNFDWQVNQTALVNTLNSGANIANLYTTAQVQALHMDVPLIQRDPGTGLFTFTFGLQKSTTLTPGSFAPFPFTQAGTSVNAAGKIEFRFTSPDNAAFFRLEPP